ncbi:MAG: NAD(P)H-hydrate dehydratase [Sphaerochaetaceae bacterium]|nr:NAD(P)H-hydrate dehydratase [Sphaerochaetaceae bacterium]
MQELYSASQSKSMDETSQNKFSILGATLMEDASFSTYLRIRDDITSASLAVFVAGGGNNGGDALAIARLAYLDGRRNIAVMLADAGKETDLRKAQRLACQSIGVRFTDALDGADLIIDGLFGIGLKGCPREPSKSLIEEINSSKAKVIALDVPSGIAEEVPFANGVKAYRTICMGELKSALFIPENRDHAGTIETTFPFFPEGAKPNAHAYLLNDQDLCVPTLKASDYKKTRKSVAIIGGSGRFTGAVILAAKAAFHAGAGLVTIFTEQNLVSLIAKAIPSAMVTTYEEATDLSAFDAVLCGPGMGKKHDDALKMALEQAKRLVIDADGIRALARLGSSTKGNCILTPHLGEYADLVNAFAKNAKPETPFAWEETLSEVQKATQATLVVKANTVTIKDSETLCFVDGQNPSLGVAGSGDVLAGMTLALFAKDGKRAAHNAALLHQKAGRLAHEKLGFYSSDDLIRFIGKA